jgi:hypothetical protein
MVAARRLFFNSPWRSIGKDDVTATAGLLLLNDIMPLIAAAVARGAVKPTGCEDQQELQAEGMALAAQMLDSAEARGKTPKAGSVAFYALQALKSGRRSGYAGRLDAMSAAAALDGQVSLRSMDEGLGAHDDDPDGEITLHDLLATNGDDTDVAAARAVDWALVLHELDERRRKVLRAASEGRRTDELAAELGVTAPRVCQVRESIGKYIVDAWGSNGIEDVTTPSKWRAGLRAATERRSGRAERSVGHA